MLKIIRLIICMVLPFGLWGCSSSSSDSGSAGGVGQLSLSLTDAATDDYKAVYVTIKEVRVHLSGATDSLPVASNTESEKGKGDPTSNNGNETGGSQEEGAADDGSWKVVASPDTTYNLLDLVNGVMEKLGTESLAAGSYTQMRLILGETPDGDVNINGQPHPYPNYLIMADDTVRELKVPSGYQSGIKLVHGFDIANGGTTELILDFDAAASIVQAGKSGKWLLKPTIKIIGVVSSGSVSGSVTSDNQTPLPLAGVLLSAQQPNPNAGDDRDKVGVEASTITDAQGGFTMNLSVGTYALVVTKEGHQAACAKVTILADKMDQVSDFTLMQAVTGVLEGTVAIQDGSDEQEATISIRQVAACSEPAVEEQVEIASIHIADGGSYSLTLPEGVYEIVAWTEGKNTVTIPVMTITGDQTTTQDIALE